jgi:hypothetical protein
MFWPILVAAAAGAIVVVSTIEVRRMSSADDSLRAKFYAEYNAYLQAPPPQAFSSTSWSGEQGKHLANIADMGPGVLPFLIDEARRTHDINLNLPLGAITRISLRHAGWPGSEMGDAATCSRLYVDWWDAGQARTDQMFADAYAAHDILRMQSLGIAALPRVMEKLDAGDDSMLEVVRKITKPLERQDVAADRANCRAWWRANKERYIVPFPDQAQKGQ